MHWTEIVTIVVTALYLLFMLIHTIKKIHRGDNLEECSCAPKKSKGGNALVEAYHARYGAKDSKKAPDKHLL